MIAIPHFSEDKVTEIYRIANDFYREFTVQRAKYMVANSICNRLHKLIIRYVSTEKFY